MANFRQLLWWVPRVIWPRKRHIRHFWIYTTVSEILLPSHD
jgi:hypothetical protein